MIARDPLLVDGLVVSCEHGGNDIPERYSSFFVDAAPLLASHRGYDLGALDLAQTLADHFHAPLIASTTSRLLVDLNRSLHHRAVFSELSRRINRKEREHIVSRYYKPHRDRLLRTLEHALANGARVLHLGVHSFTPVLHGQTRKADIAFLYDPAREQEAVFCARWCDLIRSAMPRLKVRRNYPYRGNADGLTTTLRTLLPPTQYLGVEIEMNQRFVVDADGQIDAIHAMLVETLSQLLPLSAAKKRRTN